LTGCGKSITEYASDLASGASGLVSDIASDVSGTVSDYLEEAANNTPQHYTVETFNEVFELIQAKNCQAIYDMFSEYDKANVDLMPDIEKLVEFMDGEVVEMRHVGASNDYSSVRDGVTVSAGYSAHTYVTTDSGVLYWVKVGVITAADDETKLGLDWIYILDSDAFDAYIDECVEWDEMRRNGAKEPEPERPDNIEVGVNY
ncbi:MAG: DUF5104 domain-containing protein, partial [Oscillospiraceae bacterium]|nr:DUF5104 domain-containing protein [Oscillospiraceae bacterium]